jgi:FtsP/CotA-like multicopper oxidase with cupredoxin domain
MRKHGFPREREPKASVAHGRGCYFGASALLCAAVLRLLQRSVLALGSALVIALVAWIAWLWYDSRLPGTYSVMDYGAADYGGGSGSSGVHSHNHLTGGLTVTALRDPAGAPNERFTLTAERSTVRLSSGREIDALTFDGQVPGPELRVRQGDLVEVTLVNRDVSGGVTIHWHGIDVPNAEDGVAGVTQNAVLPGQHYTYRFRVNQIGTFWYHTHQASSKQVRRGLFGPIVIEPRRPTRGLDLTLVSHTFAATPTLNASDEVQRRAVRPGTPVRLRLVNSDGTPRRFQLSGTPFRVLALDGTELNGPSLLRDVSVEVAGGGRVDLGFVMPSRPVLLSGENAAVGLALSADGSALPPPTPPRGEFDPLGYGGPTPTPFDASSRFDRRFELNIGRKPGFLDGRPGLQWTINGRIYPRVPMFVVRKGDLVEMTISNHTGSVHPMHLHGHHLLVLSRDGVPASGSPWWADTLNVKPHQTYVVAFRADNPGIWMDHCHNLRHAAKGLTMHLAYEGVSTPFKAGDAARNQPE